LHGLNAYERVKSAVQARLRRARRACKRAERGGGAPRPTEPGCGAEPLVRLMTDVSALGEFEQIVLLAVLRLGWDAAYAVSIADEIQRCTGRSVSRGSIYITLDRLESKGYLKSRLADPTPERGGRAKRYYALRPRAVEALRECRRQLIALWRGLEATLA
jgi:PadR family transcriptional regulator, regulatory protein PadR